ncbi:MAG: hypothetical protein ACK5E0_24170, partial [Bradyrhizobium sp.]|uniref:hypothetical protein n=1 Tax=Bradyrhizobium sp. TaxID=376 RepID=UPI00391D09E1
MRIFMGLSEALKNGWDGGTKSNRTLVTVFAAENKGGCVMHTFRPPQRFPPECSVYRGIPTARDGAGAPPDAAVAAADEVIQRRYLRVSDAVRSWASNNAFNGETFGLAVRPRLNRRNWNFTTAIAASEAIGLFFHRIGATSGRRS